MNAVYRSTKTLLADNIRLLFVGLATLALLWNFLVYYHPIENMSTGVLVWWTGLYSVSVLNICGWRQSAAALARGKDEAQPAVYLFRWRQLLLSAAFVLGCGFRSIMPRADVQRIGLFDTWVSNVMLGRSVATVAELCFAAQWALLLYKLAKPGHVRTALVISWLLVPLIAIAETCSWYGVLTTSYLGNAVEESIWAFSAFLVIVSLLALWPRCFVAFRPFLAAALVLGVAYLLFMCTVDIPMYVSRWLADEANGREYLSLSQGFWDVWSRRSVTYSWEEWRPEIPWMSLYFSLGVWCSIALVHAPHFEQRTRS